MSSLSYQLVSSVSYTTIVAIAHSRLAARAGTGQSAGARTVLDPMARQFQARQFQLNQRSARLTTTANDRGEFSITLDAGEYSLRVSADGFAEDS